MLLTDYFYGGDRQLTPGGLQAPGDGDSRQLEPVNGGRDNVISLTPPSPALVKPHAGISREL